MSYPAYGPPPRRKYRPRARWFVVGGVLLVLAVVVFVAALVWVLRPLTQEDAVFAAADGPVTLDLPADERRGIYQRDGEPVRCTAATPDGATIEVSRVTADVTYDEWTAVEQLTTGDGGVVLTCESDVEGAEVRVAGVPSTGGIVAGVVVGVVGPLLLGGAGFVVLLVTTILWATRPARPRGGPAR
ncbi:hypothetical protein ABFT23_15565 [Nocardioides sp. C4-1]|uniref:hypothetical protein n=1 Tax=Nocardioides sp. C4-1 TaxID=3151851 RepID=UPI00326359C8